MRWLGGTPAAPAEATGRVLFVCTANVCRSPMAEAVFDALAQDAGLPLRARSAGTHALVGEGAAPKTREVLAEVGIPPKPAHRARQVDHRAVEGVDLVLTMTPEHVEEVARLIGYRAGHVHALPGYASGAWNLGISDPYGGGLTVYRAALRQLYEHLDNLLERMAREPAAPPLARSTDDLG